MEARKPGEAMGWGPWEELAEAISEGEAERAAALAAAGGFDPGRRFPGGGMDDRRSGKTLLELAAGENLALACAALLRAGADANGRNPVTGRTAAMEAAADGAEEALAVLLEASDLAALDRGGQSALSLACRWGSEGAAELIAGCGRPCAPMSVDKAGRDALDWARRAQERFSLGWGRARAAARAMGVCERTLAFCAELPGALPEIEALAERGRIEAGMAREPQAGDWGQGARPGRGPRI